jgi:hypothetical protein
MADFGSQLKNQTMECQTSRPPKPLLDFVLGAYFQQLEVSTEAFNQNRARSLIASWQRHGRTADDIYGELEVMFPYHGHPLSWYVFADSIILETHDISDAATKKINSEVKQATLAATTEHDKKRKCVELERVEREKAIRITQQPTKGHTYGMLAGLDASMVRKVGNFVNVLPDLLALKMLHGRKWFITMKETKDGVSTFNGKYMETESGPHLLFLVIVQCVNQEIR